MYALHPRRSSTTRPIALAAVLLGIAGLIVWVVAPVVGSGDYTVHGAPGSDNAGPPIEALAHGRFAAVPHVQTVMGLTSILWRVPFVAAANALGAGDRTGYLVGAFVCLLPVVGLVGWMAGRQPSRHQLVAAAIGGVVMTVGPATASALDYGHPEEMLTILLTLFAVLAAEADRRTTAAILLGLAIGAKEWALLMAPAVLIALPSGRRRAAVVACGVALLLSAPLALLDPAAFRHADSTVGPIKLVESMTVWWPIAAVAGHHLPLGVDRPEAAGGALAMAAGLVGLVWVRMRRHRASTGGVARIDPLALLALIGLLRCITDPAVILYYFVAAVVPLAVWEVHRLRRLPIASLLAWGVLAVCFTGGMPFNGARSPLSGPPAILAFALAALVLAGYLAVRTLSPPAPAAIAPPSQAPLAFAAGVDD